MIVSNISNTKNNLSALLQRVRDGEEIVIVDRDKPVAKIVPINPEFDDFRRKLLAKGIVVREPIAPYGSKLPPLVKPKRPYSAGQLIREMRDEDRF